MLRENVVTSSEKSSLTPQLRFPPDLFQPNACVPFTLHLNHLSKNNLFFRMGHSTDEAHLIYSQTEKVWRAGTLVLHIWVCFSWPLHQAQV